MNPSLARLGFCRFKNNQKIAKIHIVFYNVYVFKQLNISRKYNVNYF